ncbi:NAD(P)-binding protein [Testicularia cyperi]|uniref:NAD(P)-binding protein n=1 Tax=Testicularia cyperi TaxID=1882483 RepID=A0A317XMI7_9BASI|nr:NAD(P)-binding protein [Testicularia cyperi]
MGLLSIDTLVLLSQWTVLKPILHAANLADRFVEHELVSQTVPEWYGPYRRNDYLALASIGVLFCWVLTWTSYLWYNRRYVRSIRKQQWQDQVIVITGGASGIGLQTAKRFAAKGAKVVTIDLQKADYGSDAPPANIFPYICDISSADALTKVAKSIRYIHGDPTVLINNAGLTNSQPITSLSAAQVARLVSVNLTAQLWMVQEFLPGMIQAARSHNRPSHIISTSSVMGHIGVSQMVDYCASKHGVVGLHKALRYELDYCHRCPQIRTTLVVLGHVKTQLFDGIRFSPLARFLGPSVDPDAVAARIVSAVHKRRGGTLAMPWYANWTEVLPLLPSWACDFVHWLLGSNVSMAQMLDSRNKNQ